MRLPGERLRRIAARFCAARTMERLIDPALADLQDEYEGAIRGGRAWYTRWALGFAPLVFAIFALALVGRGPRRRWILVVFGYVAFVGYVPVMIAGTELARDHTIPVAAAVWAPNAVLLLIAGAVMRRGSVQAR